MVESAFLPLLQNAGLLLALAVVYDLVADRASARIGRAGQVAAGLMIGAIGLAIMVTPWVAAPGVNFDTRSVLLAVSGLVFGVVPTAIAMALTAALRLAQGGAGALVGVSVILAAGSIGIAWRRWRHARVEQLSLRELYLLGIVVHVVMLALMLPLPAEVASRVLGAIAFPVIAIYPVATALLGAVLIGRLRRQQTRAALRASEERLRLATSAGAIGLWDLDVVRGVAIVNRELEQMLGYPEGGLPEERRAWEERIHPEDRDRVLRAMNDHLAGSTPGYRAEYRQRARDGTWRWILAVGEVVERDRDGRPLRMLGTYVDITDRRAAEEQARRQEADLGRLLAEATAARQALLSMNEDLRAAEREIRDTAARYQALVRHAPDAIMVNRDDRVVLANDACVALFGANGPEDLLGRDPIELFHPDDHPLIMARRRRLREGRTAVEPIHERIVRVDGSTVDVEASASAFDDDGTVSLHIVLRDITDRLRAERELRELTEDLERRVAARTAELQEANRELESFALSVSHDLRAPLRAITGFSRALATHHAHALDEEGRHYLESILAAGEQMGRLIEDLLTYARVGRRALRGEPVAIEPIVDRLRTVHASQLAESGGHIRVAAPLPAALGDPMLVEQILGNLVGNALTYHRDDVAPEVTIDGHNGHGRVTLRVTDNGIGIDPEDRERIFDLFVRLHGDDEYAGTGLGLAIARKAARVMGGDVTVDSVPGEGSTFRVELPAAAARQV